MENKKIWLIILIILGLLALAFWVLNWKASKDGVSGADMNTYPSQTNRSELSLIEKELNATDVNNLESDLANLDKEISAQ